MEQINELKQDSDSYASIAKLATQYIRDTMKTVDSCAEEREFPSGLQEILDKHHLEIPDSKRDDFILELVQDLYH